MGTNAHIPPLVKTAGSFERPSLSVQKWQQRPCRRIWSSPQSTGKSQGSRKLLRTSRKAGCSSLRRLSRTVNWKSGKSTVKLKLMIWPNEKIVLCLSWVHCILISIAQVMYTSLNPRPYERKESGLGKRLSVYSQFSST